MECSIVRSQFKDAFATASQASPVRSNIEVLSYVLAECENNSIKLTGTDTEIIVVVKVSGEIITPGRVLLPVQRMKQILSESQDEVLAIKYDGNGKLIVSGARDRFKLQVPDHSDFPVVKSPDFSNGRTIDAALLATAIRRTAFATDEDGSRYALQGILLEHSKGVIDFVGTDGKRLSNYHAIGSVVVGDDFQHKQNVLISHKYSRSILSVLAAGGTAEVATTDSLASFRCGDSSVSVRLLEGRFPRWRDVFPKTEDYNSVDVPAGIFRGALRRAAITSSTETRAVEFKFDVGSLTLSNSTADVGECECVIPVTYIGEPTTVRLGVDYLTESLADLDANAPISLFFGNSEQAVLLTTGEEWKYVVMPLAAG